MQCKFCRGDIPEGANVCPTCGTPVEPAENQANETGEKNIQNQSNDQGNSYQYNYQQASEGSYNYQSNNTQNYNQGYNQGYNGNGRNIPGGKPVSGTPYMVFSILCTLLCCLPLGIVGIVYASKINSLQKVGDFVGAQEAAKKARLFTIIGSIGGLVLSIIYIVMFVVMGNSEPIAEDSLSQAIVEEAEELDEDILEEPAEEKAPVKAKGKLGKTWDTYTVQLNDTVLSLPCDIKDLEDVGFQLDTGDKAADYIVNAGEYELVFFNDQYGHSVMFDMFNNTGKAQKIVDCQVGGIYVDEYDVEDGRLTVLFPGELQIGASKDEMLAAYGEASDVYDEGDTLHSYTWYNDDDFYKNCRIELDPKTQKVTCMSMQCYDL